MSQTIIFEGCECVVMPIEDFQALEQQVRSLGGDVKDQADEIKTYLRTIEANFTKCKDLQAKLSRYEHGGGKEVDMDIQSKAQEWLDADKDYREWHMSVDEIISDLLAELKIKNRFFSAHEMEEARLMARKRADQEHKRALDTLQEEILTVRIAEAQQRRCAVEARTKLSRYEQALNEMAEHCGDDPCQCFRIAGRVLEEDA